MLSLKLLNVNRPLLSSLKMLNEKPTGSVYLVGQFTFLKLSKSPVVLSACIRDPFYFPRIKHGTPGVSDECTDASSVLLGRKEKISNI
jgi:hypothetical protein